MMLNRDGPCTDAGHVETVFSWTSRFHPHFALHVGLTIGSPNRCYTLRGAVVVNHGEQRYRCIVGKWGVGGGESTTKREVRDRSLTLSLRPQQSIRVCCPYIVQPLSSIHTFSHLSPGLTIPLLLSRTVTARVVKLTTLPRLAGTQSALVFLPPTFHQYPSPWQHMPHL